ncbi:MAG: amidase domain-containing protein [Oscillospiraceae bacterium]
MKLRKINVLLISLIMIIAFATNISADILREQIFISDNSAEIIFEEIKDNIIFKYSDIYSFDNFSYEFINERQEDNNILIDINIFTDMTLAQHPSDSEFIKAINNELILINDENEKKLIQKEIQYFIDEIETLYYKKKDECIFKYTVKFSNTKLKIAESNEDIDYQLYYRTDITSDNIMIEPVISIKKVNDNKDQIKSDAAKTISDIRAVFLKNRAVSDFVYDRLVARDYALNHATDTPEFSSANGQGSDCANFVSKSLNEGGIPVDEDGDWYPSTNGTTATCGTNWMRTGYYNNGGVVPYMTDKGYFYEQTSESKVYAGSIMSWDAESHVALVTYGDTVTIKYTQHSNVKLTEKQAKNVVYETEQATFYMPSSTIMD